MWTMIVVFLPSILMAKSLQEYGIKNERLKAYLVESGFKADSSIDSIRTSEAVGVASGLYAATWSEILSSDDVEEIRKLTELYTTGINSVARSYVLSRMWLPPFKQEYFNKSAKQTLVNPARPNAFAYDYIHALGLVGVDHPNIDLKRFIEGNTLEESLKLPPILERAGDSQRYTSPSWAARVVLARRGDKSALDGILEAVSAMDDLKLRELSEEVLTNMGYIRQPETIDVLVDVLFSDLGAPDNPYPDYIAKYPSVRPFAYNAIKPLALAFDDFPIDYWKPTISNVDLEIAREYIRNYLKPTEAVEEAPDVTEAAAEATQLEPTVEEPAEVATAEHSEEPVEQPSQWWLWIIGAVIVVGGLGLVLRRKN